MCLGGFWDHLCYFWVFLGSLSEHKGLLFLPFVAFAEKEEYPLLWRWALFVGCGWREMQGYCLFKKKKKELQGYLRIISLSLFAALG